MASAAPELAPATQQHIEVDTEEYDSAVGDTHSSTTSLISEITKYQMENGRRYHGYQAGKYAFPNDEDELDRMDLENHLFSLLFEGRLHWAPLENPQNIIDLGTGTGIWAIDVADKFPSARVIGTDLSPTQPSNVPPNLEFQIDDLTQEWTFQENLFDLVHWRLLLGSISDYPSLFRECFKHIKPGGYLEIHDLNPHFYCDDDSLPKDCANVTWSDIVVDAMSKMGKVILPLGEYKRLMEEAGFVGIEERVFKRPSNAWPKDKALKEIGRFTQANMIEGIEGFTMAPFTRALGWKKEEIDILLAKCKAEWKDKSIHAHQKVIMIYGRKPEA